MSKPATRRLTHSLFSVLPAFGRGRRATETLVGADAEDEADVPRVITGQGTGKARLLEPGDGVVVAGSTVRLVFEYVVGDVPLAEGSQVLLCFYHVCLWSPAQTQDPKVPGYVAAAASVPLTLKAWGDLNATKKYKLTQFPWHHVIEITVGAGGLGTGERILVTYGAGEARATAQPFAATPYNFRVVVTPAGAGPVPAEEHPILSVVGGPAARLVLVTPSDHFTGAGRLLARLEDEAGNLATGYSGSLSVHLEGDAAEGRSVHRFEASASPVHLFEIAHGAACAGRFVGHTDTGLVAVSNPFRVRDRGETPNRTLWGEIHGHSNRSDGYGTPEEYFAYARNVAGLDVACLTDHDFMLSDADWQRIKRACNAANETGRFATLQAYEWSAVTDVGGDRNLYFAGDDPPIRRSRTLHDPVNPFVYHGRERQVNHVEDLYLWMDQELGPDAVLAIPHFGGRPANPRFHDPRYEPLVEIFSEHRRSEGFVTGFRAHGGHIGVVGGGDDHIGRPGNGFLLHGPFEGGLGLVAVKSGLGRAEVFNALRARRTYATTGARIIVDFDVAGADIGSEIVISGVPRIAFSVLGTTSIKHVQLFRDGVVTHELAEPDLGREVDHEWLDDDFGRTAETHSYSLRVTQVDGHVAVTSPIWASAARSGEDMEQEDTSHA